MDGRRAASTSSCHGTGHPKSRPSVKPPSEGSRPRAYGCSAASIAEALNAAGWHPPKRPAFEAGMIQRLMFRHGMTAGRPIWSRSVPRQPGAEWTLHEAAERLGIHRHTAYRWVRQGHLHGKLATRGGQHIWLVTMTTSELDQLRAASPQPTRIRNPA